MTAGPPAQLKALAVERYRQILLQKWVQKRNKDKEEGSTDLEGKFIDSTMIRRTMTKFEKNPSAQRALCRWVAGAINTRARANSTDAAISSECPASGQTDDVHHRWARCNITQKFRYDGSFLGKCALKPFDWGPLTKLGCLVRDKVSYITKDVYYRYFIKAEEVDKAEFGFCF